MPTSPSSSQICKGSYSSNFKVVTRDAEENATRGKCPVCGAVRSVNLAQRALRAHRDERGRP